MVVMEVIALVSLPIYPWVFSGMPNADEFQVAGSGHMVAGACPWQPPTVIHGVSRVGSLCQS